MKKEKPCKKCDKKRYGNTSWCFFHWKEREEAKRAEKLARKTLRKEVGKSFKKDSKKTLKANLWQLCKQIIRLKYGPICYTCGATGLSGSNWHTAHFIPSGRCGLYLKYDLRNLRPGCYNCNINLGGNGAIYYRKMVEREGQEYVDQIFGDLKRITPESSQWYLAKIEEYKKILAELPVNNYAI